MAREGCITTALASTQATKATLDTGCYTSYVIVENRRENGRVKQRTVYTLGKDKTIPGAIQTLQAKLNHWNSLPPDVLAVMWMVPGAIVDLAQSKKWAEQQIATLKELQSKMACSA